MRGEFTMKIAVLFASNRHGGKHEEIKQMMSSLNLPVDYNFVELADYIIVLQQQAKKTSSLIDQTLQLSYTNGSGDIFSKSFFRMHLMKSVSSILLFF